MPIEGYTEFEEAKGEKWETPIVEPGRFKEVAVDYSSGDYESIMAYCQIGNNGGLVFQVNSRVLQLSENPTEVLKHHIKGHIRADKPYQRDITTASGRIATLHLELT